MPGSNEDIEMTEEDASHPISGMLPPVPQQASSDEEDRDSITQEQQHELQNEWNI